MKNCSVGSELFYEGGQANVRTDRQSDRQTDTIKLIVVFRSFAQSPYKGNAVEWDNDFGRSSLSSVLFGNFRHTELKNSVRPCFQNSC